MDGAFAPLAFQCPTKLQPRRLGCHETATPVQRAAFHWSKLSEGERFAYILSARLHSMTVQEDDIVRGICTDILRFVPHRNGEWSLLLVCDAAAEGLAKMSSVKNHEHG
jgi:hypothetical protein